MTGEEFADLYIRQLSSLTKKNIRIRYKTESLFGKTIHTTLGRAIWLDSREWVNNVSQYYLVGTLMHEARHALDWSLSFFLGYLAPQIFLCAATLILWAICGVLYDLPGIFHLGFGAGLLVSLAPWPSPWRVRWERRGYRMNMAAAFIYGASLDNVVKSEREALNSSLYYFMLWSKKRAIDISYSDEVICAVLGSEPWSDPSIVVMGRILNQYDKVQQINVGTEVSNG